MVVYMLSMILQNWLLYHTIYFMLKKITGVYRGLSMHKRFYSRVRNKCTPLNKHTLCLIRPRGVVTHFIRQTWEDRSITTVHNFGACKSLMHHDIQKLISYHNLYLFFPICKWKELKLFQLLESFKQNVLMHRPSIKKSLHSYTVWTTKSVINF